MKRYLLSPEVTESCNIYQILYLLGKFTLTITEQEYNLLNTSLKDHFVEIEIDDNKKQESQSA